MATKSVIVTSTMKAVTPATGDIGFTEENLKKMKSAITNWENAILGNNGKGSGGVDVELTTKQIAAAVKGSAQQAKVKALCQSCNDKVKELIKTLDRYKTILEVIAGNYRDNDQNSTSISDYNQKVKDLNLKS